MKPTELRIGNLINRYFEGKYSSQDICTIRDIWEIHSSHNTDVFTFEPIPLNENWLIKFGFEEEVKNIDSPMPRFVVWRKEIFTYNTIHGWWIDGKQISGLKCEYVHQLQNLYFAITGDELKLT